MYKDEYGNIKNEMTIMDIIEEMDKPYDPRIDEKGPIYFSSHEDSEVPLSQNDEEQEAVDNITEPLPARFDIFRRLLEMEERSQERQQSVGTMMDEIRKMQSTVNGQQSANSNHLNEIRIQQMAIIQQNESSISVLQDCQGSNRSSYQIRSDCEGILKTVEAKVVQLDELNEQINKNFDSMSNKQVELEAVGSEIQSKIEWATTQNENIAHSYAELHEFVDHV